MAKQTAPTQAEIELLSSEDQEMYKKLLEAAKGFYEIGESGKKSAVEADPSYRPLLGQASKAVRALMGRHKDAAASAVESEIKRNRDNPDRERRGASRAAERGAAVADSEIAQLGTERELRKVSNNKKAFMKSFPTSTDIAEVKQKLVLKSQGREKVTDSNGTTRVVGGTNKTVQTDVPVRKGAKKTKKVTKKVPTGKAGKNNPALPITDQYDAEKSDVKEVTETLQTTNELNNTIPLMQKGTGFVPRRERADRLLKAEVDAGNIRIVRPGEAGHSNPTNDPKESQKPEVHQEDAALPHVQEILNSLRNSSGFIPSKARGDRYGRTGHGADGKPTNKDYVNHILYMEGWGDTPDEELAPTNMQEGPQMDESDMPIEQRSDTPATTQGDAGMFGGKTEIAKRADQIANSISEQDGPVASSDISARAERGDRSIVGELPRAALSDKALEAYAMQGPEITAPPAVNPVSEALSEQGQQLSDEERARIEKDLDKVAPEDRERIRRAGALSAQFDLNLLRLRAGEEDRGAPAPVYKDRTFYTRKGKTVIKRVPDIDPVTGLQRTKVDSNGKIKKVWKKDQSQEIQTKDVVKGQDETFSSTRPYAYATGNATEGNTPVEEALINAAADSNEKTALSNAAKVRTFEDKNPHLTEDSLYQAQIKLENLQQTDRTNFSQEDHDSLDANIAEAEYKANKLKTDRESGIASLELRSAVPERVGATKTDIGLDPLAMVKNDPRSTIQATRTAKGTPRRTTIRRSKKFVENNNIILQEMAQDATERQMSVPSYYVSGNTFTPGSGSRSSLTAEGSEAIPAGIKEKLVSKLGEMQTNVADPLEDELNYAPSVKVDENQELVEPGVLRKMKSTAKGYLPLGETTQETGNRIIQKSGLPAWLGVIAASAVEPAARQRIADRAAGVKPELLSRSQFDARQVAAGNMPAQQAEDNALTDEYDKIANQEAGERILRQVNALNERKPHVEQALMDFTELKNARDNAETEMRKLLNSDDPLVQHPRAVDKKTGLINPRYTKLGVLRSDATDEEKELHKKTQETHDREIKKAGKKAMEEHIAALESKAGLKKDVRSNPIMDSEGTPVPLELNDAINDEVDIDTRVHVLKALHRSLVNPVTNAPKTREREQIAYNKVGTEPVGTPETHPSNFVSEAQLQEHKGELEFRKSERQRISEQIGTAAEMGDLRENADYDAAKDEQGLNEDAIAALESHITKIESNPSKHEGHYVNPRAVTETSMVDHPTEKVLLQGPETPKAGTEAVRMRGGPAPRGFFGRTSIPKKVPILQQKQMPVWATPPSEETVEEPVFKKTEKKKYDVDNRHVGSVVEFDLDEAGNKIPELGPDGKQLTRTVPKTPGVLARDSETGDAITTSTGQAEVFAVTPENIKNLGATPIREVTDQYVRVQGLPRVTEKLKPQERTAIAAKQNLVGLNAEDVIHLALNSTGRFTPVEPTSRISGLTGLQFSEVASQGERMDRRNPVTEATPTNRENADVNVVGDDTTAPSSTISSQFNIPESTVERTNLAKALGINQSIVTPGSLSRQMTMGAKPNTKNTTKLAVMRGRLARQDAPEVTDLTGGRKPPVVSGPSPQYYPKPEDFFKKDPTPAPMPTGYGSLVKNAIVSPEHQTAIQRNAHVLRTAPNESYARVAQSKQFAPQVMQATLNTMGAIFGTGAPSVELPPAPTMSSVSGIPESGMSRTPMSKTIDDGYAAGETGEAGRKIVENPDYKPTESEVGEMVHSTTDEGPVTNARELGRQRKQHEKLTADRNSAISTVAGQLLRSRATGATIGNL
jgi:hypothetical protein